MVLAAGVDAGHAVRFQELGSGGGAIGPDSDDLCQKLGFRALSEYRGQASASLLALTQIQTRFNT